MADRSDKWAGAAALAAGAAIGSAAIAAGLLWARSRRDRNPKSPPARPHEAPETD